MADYHVGCGLAVIYAGTLKKNGYEWNNKSDVTEEAIRAVANYMLGKIPKGESSFSYRYRLVDNRRLNITVIVFSDDVGEDSNNESN